MSVFIVLCVIMALIAVAAVAVPLWMGGRINPDVNRRESVLAILRQQAKELETERDAGRIDIDEYEESRIELERRVLEEAQHDEEEKVAAASKSGPRTAIVMAVLIPAMTVGLYVALGMPKAMDESFLQMVAAQRSPGGHSATEMAQAIDTLKERLKQDPTNAEGWFMLARSTASVNRFDESVAAFRELNKLVPNNPDLMADMADMLAAANGKVITPEVVELLNKALAINPDQWKALALLAIYSWDKEQYARAAQYWEHLLKVVPPDFPDIEQIRANINEAKRLGGVNDNVAQVSGEAVKPTKLKEIEKPVPTASALDTPAFVSGTVTLSEKLKAKASPEDTVFIYARPVTGSKMPVAFMKVKVKDLPYNFKLDETMMMATGSTKTLASVKTVIVGARISQTGNFMPQTGDLEGDLSNPIEVGDSGVVVVIDKVLN